MNLLKLKIIGVLVICFQLKAYCQEPPPTPVGQSPSIVGTWYNTIPNTEITEAGNDFPGAFESAANQMVFNRNATSYIYPNWSVTIKKYDILWHSNIKIWIRRTGDGTGVSGSSISNGANYVEIVNTPTSFFNGYKEVDEIPLQLKVTGISVTIPANSYYTLLTFTITEN